MSRARKRCNVRSNSPDITDEVRHAQCKSRIDRHVASRPLDLWKQKHGIQNVHESGVQKLFTNHKSERVHYDSAHAICTRVQSIEDETNAHEAG